ncbi:hypothetical protein [Paraburkholderia sp. BL23I1N1]|uniref:hypothetical protein n=1 Tax=Paraburkholderia sp. BL23I1N1 TaxID=1938802 RepID=UPI000E729EAB|nr:hypothetical protein [Paraburkholderia sp. BL23I1N1]
MTSLEAGIRPYAGAVSVLIDVLANEYAFSFDRAVMCAMVAHLHSTHQRLVVQNDIGHRLIAVREPSFAKPTGEAEVGRSMPVA